MMETYYNTTNTLPSYIRSNAGLYDRIAETFYTEIAKAHTEEEYKNTFSKMCRYYMKDFSNEDVQRYLLESGTMETEDIEAIKQFYIDNAEPLQKTILSSNMEEGKRYTLVYMNEFGFPVADKITFMSVTPCQYAQYTDAVKMVFKRARKRNAIAKYFYNCSIAIYEGWHDLQKEDTYNKTRETAEVTCYMSKYTCFDSRFFSDAVEKFGKPLAEYRNFKTGTNGKVYA